MSKYRVTVTRPVTQSTTVEVEAESRSEANDKALEQVGRYGEKVSTWELDDGNQDEAYIPDPDSAELLPEEREGEGDVIDRIASM